ncbi:MAG: transcription antitermination factor NusB [Bdellovibrionaceae bacterium]|nr:transcription antitermination factor NusB [Pseudobdellovibrionaceae bacterium]
MSRRRLRTVVFQTLYESEFGNTSFNTLLDKKFFSKNLNSSDSNFVKNYLKGIKKHRACLDETINRYSKNWKINRMSLVDLNIIRLAIFEMLFCPEIPDKVALNEALELAKQFGEKNSSGFINGILNQIIQK